jgi:colanic acid/amylovoran biosynthesis glycosyltransferase
VGDGPERRTLEAQAARLQLEHRVQFRGWLPFHGARDAMARATILVHPSDGLGDGLPNVIREAMALGTPVVASDVAGIPDALGDGCGVLVPPQNPAALADGIATLLADENARSRIAERARRRVEERYDVWQNGATLAELLRHSRRGMETRRRAALTPARMAPDDV